MPRKFTNQEYHRIEKDLISSGIDMFSRYGVQNVTVDQLVAQVGISKGAFYHFYESKLELYIQVITSIQATINSETEDLIHSLVKRPDQILIELVKYSKKVQHQYYLINSENSYLTVGVNDVQISGEIVVEALQAMKAICDFSSGAIESLLSAVGRISFSDDESEGQTLLNDVLDTGFSAFIRY